MVFNIILIILLPFFLWYNIKKNIEKYYDSNELIQKLDVDYEFYETYFVEKSKNGEMRVEYNKLNEIIETKTNFYLMISKNQGHMLLKENMSDDLQNFIRKLK